MLFNCHVHGYFIAFSQIANILKFSLNFQHELSEYPTVPSCSEEELQGYFISRLWGSYKLYSHAGLLPCNWMQSNDLPHL